MFTRQFWAWPLFFTIMHMTQKTTTLHSKAVALLYYLCIYNFLGFPSLFIEEIFHHRTLWIYVFHTEEEIFKMYFISLIPYFSILIYAHERYFKEVEFAYQLVDENTTNRLTIVELTIMFSLIFLFHILSFYYLYAPSTLQVFHDLLLPNMLRSVYISGLEWWWHEYITMYT